MSVLAPTGLAAPILTTDAMSSPGVSARWVGPRAWRGG